MALPRDEAVSALYLREYDALCRAAYRAMGDREAAEDLVQDTFLLALLHADELPAHPAPGAWLMTTLRNLIANERRKIARRGTLALEDVGDLPAAERTPALEELLPAALSEEERRLLLWRFGQELPYSRIAGTLGITEGAARLRVFRAVEKCKRLMT